MYELINSTSPKWNKYLKDLPRNIIDIYFTSEYYNMYELNGDGIAKLFVYVEDHNIALYPFMMNEITDYELNDKYYDIESAYGYGGPISNCLDKEFLIRFEKCFLNYCRENNIIAEFVRFHPLIGNYNLFSEEITTVYNRNTVFLDLSKGVDKVWKEEIKSKNRNMIRKAEKSGLVVEKSNNYECFKDIYAKTMNKVNAEDYYYFNSNYYNTMSENSDYILLNVKYENSIIASAIFMKCGDFFHYHLAGSLKEYLKFSPNNLLLWEAIKIASASGCKFFHFGGGLSDSLEDTLFKFKNGFSREIASFFIGKRIHNERIYDCLISAWENKNNKKSKLFLQYKF